MAGVLCVVAVASLLLIRRPPVEVSKEIRSESGGFSIRVPEGWVTREYEPTGDTPCTIHLGSHEPLLLDRWKRAGIWVARCDRANGRGFFSSGERVERRRLRFGGREAVRSEAMIPPPGLLDYAPGVSIRVVEYFVITDRHTYQVGYWSYPPHSAEGGLDALVESFEVL